MAWGDHQVLLCKQRSHRLALLSNATVSRAIEWDNRDFHLLWLGFLVEQVGGWIQPWVNVQVQWKNQLYSWRSPLHGAAWPRGGDSGVCSSPSLTLPVHSLLVSVGHRHPSAQSSGSGILSCLVLEYLLALLPVKGRNFMSKLYGSNHNVTLLAVFWLWYDWCYFLAFC